MEFTSIEICAGAGGQALGLEWAGFNHECLVELDATACQTLKENRPNWHVVNADLRQFSAKSWNGVDLLAGGVPCPPFSKAGKQLGSNDDRDLFPEAIRLLSECRPKALMLENVRGLLDPQFRSYRQDISREVEGLGYLGGWKLMNASDFGVPQLRPRVLYVALRKEIYHYFNWPALQFTSPPTVGEALFDLMIENNWKGASKWRELAAGIAPTLVGGSKKHGGPDLGPTRAKNAWKLLGVDGKGIADSAPEAEFTGLPRLTVRMAARLQGFPDDWRICGKKTSAYKQVGNAFPPPVAYAVGRQIHEALMTELNQSRMRA